MDGFIVFLLLCHVTGGLEPILALASPLKGKAINEDDIGGHSVKLVSLTRVAQWEF